MAIQFARIEIVGRSSGGNACCKGAYNARTIIKDQKTNITYNFSNRGDNVYHDILLPEGVDWKFKNIAELMNSIEHIERKNNSQLLKDAVIALPDDKELDLQDRINITHRIIEKMEWVKNGLAVQIDIHEPHDGEKNWHAHLLITTRRFTINGKRLGAKARDLNPEFKTGKYGNFIVPEETLLQHHTRDVINDYFKELGLENRVDTIGINPREHIGPVRMRSVLNQASDRNEARRIAELEHLSSGLAVLDKVTRHMSVFSRGDLIRAVKCVPDDARAKELVEDALASKSIITLFTEDGSKTQYFTTREVRLEESKILRLSGYVASGDNVFAPGDKSFKHTQGLIESARGNLSGEQHIALVELIASNSSLRILRGRAGVGKSHVLRQIASIAKASNIKIIGLSPTHKAKEVLSSHGFEHTDTIKGMLFKLHNARFSLPKHSLLVVDEAGMIGNDDYQELLRVAATRQCNVILSGDERQLASVGRGGMFEVFAGKYGSSTLLDIKRQKSVWGKEVATAFSQGNVREGISILSQEDRINRQSGGMESMEALLADWHKSSHSLSDRLILAVKNNDVSALNHGARQYLKQIGKLTGSELEVGGNFYMKGDLILIQKTNKELRLVNGDLAEILEVTKDRFVISMQSRDNKDNSGNAEIIEFNPAEYNGFRHGYATTVFKAQGASIKDVYVFHDGFAGLRNSYVALSRNINELNLYVNSKATPSPEALIKQLAYDPEQGSSLNFYSEEDSKTLKQNSETLANIGLFDSMLLKTYDFAVRNITKLTDKYLPKSEYYNYQEPDQRIESVNEVIDRIYEQNQNIGFVEEYTEEKLVVGGNINIPNKTRALPIDAKLDNILTKAVNTSTTRPSAKSRFYANVDDARGKLQRQQQQRAIWSSESEELRKETRICAEQIARDLLGEPNKHLSNGRELKFGDTGKIAVRISGEKAGTWYDFSEGRGGDLFSLVEHKQGGDFKCAAEYLRRSIGMVSSINNSQLQLVHDHENSNITEKYIKEQKAKQAIVNKLYASSKIIENGSTACNYLSKVRAINCPVGGDIRTTTVYEKETNRPMPAVIAFARDADGNITGALQILLDDKTANKACVSVPKKSLGKIKGSFIEVGLARSISDDQRNSISGHSLNKVLKAEGNIDNRDIDVTKTTTLTIIAEGLETALSVKQALSNDVSSSNIEFKVLCSLGVHNIKNYNPTLGEKIIIAADSDGHDSITHKTVEYAKQDLKEKGAFIEVVRPEGIGDFNDILQDKTLGEKEIQALFSRALSKHAATTLLQYFALGKEGGNDSYSGLSKEEEIKINYLAQFKVDESKIVDAYRDNYAKGRKVLEGTIKPIAIAHDYVKYNNHTINSANLYGATINRRELTLALVGKSTQEMDRHLFSIREKHYFRYSLDELTRARQKAKTFEDSLKALRAEQKFLSSLHDNHMQGIHSKELLNSIQCAHQNEQHNVFSKIEKLTMHMGRTEIKQSDVCSILKSSTDSHSALNGLTEKYHEYVIHILNKSLGDIHKGVQIIANNKPFTSKIKLLEHVLHEQRNNEFFPKDYAQNIHHELINHEKHLSHNFHSLTL